MLLRFNSFMMQRYSAKQIIPAYRNGNGFANVFAPIAVPIEKKMAGVSSGYLTIFWFASAICKSQC